MFTNLEAMEGGAIYLDKNGNLSKKIESLASTYFMIQNSKFHKNTAYKEGGAIFGQAVSMNISGSYFSKNSAHLGGAIYSNPIGKKIGFYHPKVQL